MAIRVACPGCGKGLTARDRHAGRRAKCPACGVAVEVPVLVVAAPNGQATSRLSRRRPGAARDAREAGTGTDDVEGEYVSPPFRSPGSSPSGAVPSGYHVPRPALAGRPSPRRGIARDPWPYLLSRLLGQVLLGIGGLILSVGVAVNQARGGGGPGAVLVAGGALVALVAGAGLLLLVDVARSLRRLSRGGAGGAGVE